jgi:ferredoxin
MWIGLSGYTRREVCEQDNTGARTEGKASCLNTYSVVGRMCEEGRNWTRGSMEEGSHTACIGSCGACVGVCRRCGQRGQREKWAAGLRELGLGALVSANGRAISRPS